MNLKCVLFALSILMPHTLCCSTIQEAFNFHTVNAPDQFYYIKHSCVHIVGLTRANLERLIHPVEFIDIVKFTFDDLSTLNQPNLFANHTTLHSITFSTYYDPEKIALHDDVFGGLVNLNVVTLSGLNMETIPKNVFSHSPKLKIINVSHNKLKSLDSNTFSRNSYLTVIDLSGNQLLQSDQSLDLTLARNKTTMYISESYIKDFNSLVALFNNPNILNIHFDSSNYRSLKLRDFAQFPERQNMLNIQTRDANYAFYVTSFIGHGINAKILTGDELSDQFVATLRAYVYNTVSMGSNLCMDCQFIKDSFKSYLRHGRFFTYLEDQHIVFEFILECTALEKRYTIEFTDNCPIQCKCKYNPFLDKVWFDCTEMRLMSVPEIRLPEQFSKINSISIDLSKNNLETFDLSNIDHSVIELITEINLNQNQLKFVNFEDIMLSKLHQIQLCQNPIWDIVGNFTMFVGNTRRFIGGNKCLVGVPLPINPLSYMSAKSEAELDKILKDEQCISHN